MGRFKLIVMFIACFLTGALSAENTIQNYSSAIESVLISSGDNRPELEKVLAHYLSDPDTLKLAAAEYLIANMGDHCFATYSFEDTLGNNYSLDVMAYPDFDSLIKVIETMETEHGTLDFKKGEKYPDVEHITADFLISNIDLAFKAWREKPWAKDYTPEQFMQYILPYRGSNEPLEEWRGVFLDKHSNLSSAMEDNTSIIEAAIIINRDVMNWFGFDSRYYLHPTDQSLSEMMGSGLGRCEDMTNLSIYAMRANGLAVTSDYTPHWANSGNNHAWNAIIYPDGRAVPFMGAEANPGEYSLNNKAAKIYRKLYHKQPGNLIFQERKQEAVPGWLKGESYLDVTADYMPVSNPIVQLNDPIPDSIDIAYICVFNSGQWRAIDWGKMVNNSVSFKNIGRSIMYLPAFYANKEIEPSAPPFILHEEGTIEYVLPDTSATSTVKLTATTKISRKTSTDGIEPSNLKDSTMYELFYWDDDWQSLGENMAMSSTIEFKNVPMGAVYWLVKKDSDKEERIFTIENDKQVWW